MTGSAYEKQWTEANGDAIVVEAGGSPFDAVMLFPHKFEITKVVFTLVSGSNGGFTVDLYNLPVYGGDTDDDGDGSLDSLVPVGDPDLALVMPRLTAAGGTAKAYATAGPWPFVNKEGSITVPKKRIFARITIASQSGENVFEAAIAGFNVS
jgi:hypothetical protein